MYKLTKQLLCLCGSYKIIKNRIVVEYMPCLCSTDKVDTIVTEKGVIIKKKKDYKPQISAYLSKQLLTFNQIGQSNV